MGAALAVFRREFGASLSSPVAWAATVLLVLALHLLFFFVGFPIGDRTLPAFWSGRVAMLDGLFAWLPVFFAILAPALTMGSWAEERRAGTDEILMSLPVRTRELVLGKFLASWCLLAAITVLAILPVALMVDSVGSLDWGTVWGGTLGACLLAGASVGVGLATSACAREELVAFLGSAAILGLLWALMLVIRILPGEWADAAYYASPALHFLESSARGLLDLRDAIYFLLFTGGALLINISVVEGRRWG